MKYLVAFIFGAASFFMAAPILVGIVDAVLAIFGTSTGLIDWGGEGGLFKIWGAFAFSFPAYLLAAFAASALNED
jgi:hypothetical protein